MCCLVAPLLSLSGAATSRRLQSARCTRPAHISDLVFLSRATTPETTCLPTCSNMRLEVKISPIHESPPPDRAGRINPASSWAWLGSINPGKGGGKRLWGGAGQPWQGRLLTPQSNPIKVHHRMSTHQILIDTVHFLCRDCIALVSAQTGF